MESSQNGVVGSSTKVGPGALETTLKCGKTTQMKVYWENHQTKWGIFQQAMFQHQRLDDLRIKQNMVVFQFAKCYRLSWGRSSWSSRGQNPEDITCGGFFDFFTMGPDMVRQPRSIIPTRWTKALSWCGTVSWLGTLVEANNGIDRIRIVHGEMLKRGKRPYRLWMKEIHQLIDGLSMVYPIILSTVSACFNMFQHVSTIQGNAGFRNHGCGTGIGHEDS